MNEVTYFSQGWARVAKRKAKWEIRSIGTASTALYFALLWGMAYLILGLGLLVIASIVVNEGGFADGLLKTAVYVNAGLIPLLLSVALATFIGAMSGLAVAVLYNAVARQTGGIVIALGSAEA